MKKRWLNSFTVSLLAAVVALVVYWSFSASFLPLEFKAYDMKVRARGDRPVSGQVVVVAVDEKSLAKEGRWPWPRTRLADLIDKLTESKATAIGLDMLFPEKDIYIPLSHVQGEAVKRDFKNLNSQQLSAWLNEVGDSDARFAKAIERSERTVLGYFTLANREQAGETFDEMGPKEFELLDFSQYSLIESVSRENSQAPLRSLYAVGLSLPVLMNAANSAGYVSFIPSKDGVVRRVPLVQYFKDYAFPPMSLQVLKEAVRANLWVKSGSGRILGIKLGDRSIPINEHGDFLINYYGEGTNFRHISATDVLSGKVGASELEGKIVLVGATAAATHDMHTTPYGPLVPGVEVHATIIENIISQDYVEQPRWVWFLDVAIILISGLLLGIVSLFFRAYGTAVWLLAGVGGYLFLDFYLFSTKGLWIHTVFPVLSQMWIYFAITLYRFAFEEKERRFIKSAFSQYLSPTVVNQLVENPQLLKLGGERKVITAFFSDVAGFSSISEQLQAEELVDLLNLYLTDMTEIILRHEGTVDKYEGDAIIAFFGAPISYQDHATRTCLSAIEMQERLAQLREGWKQEGKHELFMRIGINTGQVVVGNMGSVNRMDYTMMGDSVNLAARLEGVNKQYQTQTMISEFTYEMAKQDIEAREVDSIRVVGKSEPVKIYELLGRKGEIPEHLGSILPHFHEGLNHYKNRKWEEGIDCFEKALNLYEDDGPSLTYFERCINFQTYPPPPDWDGVFVMRSK